MCYMVIRMITKQDIAKLQGTFITQDNFYREMKEFRSEILGRFSDVMGELQTIREEQTIGGYRQR